MHLLSDLVGMAKADGSEKGNARAVEGALQELDYACDFDRMYSPKERYGNCTGDRNRQLRQSAMASLLAEFGQGRVLEH